MAPVWRRRLTMESKSMEIEVKIDSMKDGKKLYVTLSIDGEVGVGKKRLRSIHDRKLVKK